MNTIGSTPKLDRLYRVYMDRAPYFLKGDHAADIEAEGAVE